ncbi:MAG TPA: hypothetical protein VGL91_14825 [Acidobacteriota bacterium]
MKNKTVTSFSLYALLSLAVSLCTSLGQGQSIQDLGFTKAAAVEVVFPTVVFGNSSVGRLTTEIVVVNQTDRNVYVETDLYDSDGAVPRLTLDNQGTTNPLTGAFRVGMSANSISVITYPSATPGELLVGPPFSGWLVVRANGPVTIYERIKVADPDSVEPPFEFNLNGNQRPVREAKVPVALNTRGFPYENSGISVVNPDELKGLKLQIELLDYTMNVLQRKLLELPPRGHRAFVVRDFFDPAVINVGFVRIRSDNDASNFAFTALNFLVYQRNQRQRPLLFFRFPATIDGVSGEQLTSISFGGGSWNFPENIRSTARIRDLEIILSNFGFFIRSDDGSRLGPFPVFESDPTITINETAGIAVIAGPGSFQNRPFSKPIIFAKQRKVAYELMHGHVAYILDLPDKSQAEIKTEGFISVGLTASVASWFLLDKDKGEVIGRFSGGAGQLPPWRH